MARRQGLRPGSNLTDHGSRARWSITRHVLVAVVVAVAHLSHGTASAQQPQDVTWCDDEGKQFTADLQINGCTAVIQSGRWSGKDLDLRMQQSRRLQLFFLGGHMGFMNILAPATTTTIAGEDTSSGAATF
jgi:hypothetical protein